MGFLSQTNTRSSGVFTVRVFLLTLDYCGFWSNQKSGVCSSKGFGHPFDPVNAVYVRLFADPSTNLAHVGDVSKLESALTPLSNLQQKSKAAFYLLFVGTILIGLAFLITCLVHMSALVIAGFFAFVGFALLVSGAAIYTYILHKFKTGTPLGFNFDYGNSLWFAWAAAACALFALPALGSASVASRRRYYNEPYY